MVLRNVPSTATFEEQRQEINLLAADVNALPTTTDLSTDTSPQLSADLDLNGHNISGTGISISPDTISAGAYNFVGSGSPGAGNPSGNLVWNGSDNKLYFGDAYLTRSSNGVGWIGSSGTIFLSAANGITVTNEAATETYFTLNAGSNTALYHNTTIKLNTTVSGIEVFGDIDVSGSSIAAGDITNWNSAYGWGDHGSAGYWVENSVKISNWDSAYGWGDHGSAGYLTSYTETDPVFTASEAANITSTDTTNWDTAYGWGDHSSAGYSTYSSNQATDTTSNVTFGDLTLTGIIQSNTQSAGNIELDSTGGFTSPPLKLYATTGNIELDNPNGDTSLSIGDKANSEGRLILTSKLNTVEIHSRSNHPIEFLFNTTTKASIDIDGTISDSIGPLRKLGSNTQSGAYTLVATDAGKFVAQSSNSAAVTVPNGVFAAGDMVTVVNLTATNINIVQGSGLDLNFTADGTTGTRTLAQKGVCTILFVSSGTSFISGSGLS